MGEYELSGEAASGRIGYRLWVGVTGHRSLVEDPRLVQQLREVVQRIRRLPPPSAATPVRLGVVSPLAEGADRLVAREILRLEGSALEAALPLPPEQYVGDFTTPVSRAEFQELLEGASMVTVLAAGGNRDEAYLRVGQYVVDRCDVLIAIWDGLPARGQGGTAEIVQRARQRGVPMFLIQPSDSYEIAEERGKIAWQELEAVDDYNRAKLSEDVLSAQVERQSADWIAKGGAAGLKEGTLQPLVAWSAPYMVRADLFAGQYQRRYFYLGNGLFLSAAAAVTAAAAQHIFQPEGTALVWVEIVLMILLLGGLAYGRRRQVHTRWISYRSLAERFRAATFLAVATLGADRQYSSDRAERADTSSDWIRRSSEEAWITRPEASSAPPDIERLKRFLDTAWIDDQIGYHQQASMRNEQHDRRFTQAIALLFGVTLLAAILHAASFHGLEVSPQLGDWLVLVSIMLPAVAAGLGGIRAQREYLRNSERSARMAHTLQALKSPLERAPDLASVRALARTTGTLMLEENRDWFGTMRFHDIELHI
jgi:FtsH-binding integral membrane protein